jgi:predicted PurR-regulated permease PerM
MTIRLRTAFFIVVGLLVLWFLYVERAILTPFILAAVFAYIFNPLVNFFSHKIKLPRTISVIIIYLLIVSIVVAIWVAFSGRIVNESVELRQQAGVITATAKSQVNNLPDWIKPSVNDAIQTIENPQNFSFTSMVGFLPKAFSRILSFIIFLFAAFYFLKEGRSMFDKALNFIPADYRVEADILIRRINVVLGSYLRGQIFIVLFVSSVLFLALSILGIHFALILAVFSGIAEIVPIIGPIVATSVTVIVALLTGSSNFNLSPVQIGFIIIAIYFILRQFQDYVINPYIMGKITKLHPLIILFSVIAGEHIAGILGLILAVPTAGILRIIFEYSLDRINNRESLGK